MRGFLSSLESLVRRAGYLEVIEVGCGEGYLSCFLSGRGVKVRGYDVSEDIIAIARENARRARHDIKFFKKSIYDLDPATDSADLVVCCEVLEHLKDPERGLSKLSHICRGELILSVPREPIWRVLNVFRGKYLLDLGNTPGHINHWSKRGITELVSRYFKVVDVRSPFPWTMIRAKEKGAEESKAANVFVSGFKEHKTFVRYLVSTGSIYILTCICLLTFLVEFLGAGHKLAFAVVLATSFILNFFSLRNFVFAKKQNPVRKLFLRTLGTSLAFRFLEFAAFSAIDTLVVKAYVATAFMVQATSYLIKFFVYRRTFEG